MTAWLPLVGKSRPLMPGGKIEGQDLSVPGERATDVLRGLAFACARFDTAAVAGALGDLAMACFKMIPGVGARCIRPGDVVDPGVGPDEGTALARSALARPPTRQVRHGEEGHRYGA